MNSSNWPVNMVLTYPGLALMTMVKFPAIVKLPQLLNVAQ